MKKWTVPIIAGILLLSGCANEKQSETEKGTKKLQKVSIMLDWTPNTNHTGIYVAKDKGYFKKEGLDVEILPPGEGTSAEQLVARGKADFGVSYQENVTNSRASGIPIVSIAAVIQHNTSGFASLKKDHITRPKDFEGKRYGGWGSPAEEAMIKGVMEKDGADYKKVKNVTLGQTNFFTSIGKDADFEWIYYGWDGVEAKRKGKDINILMVKDLDPALDYYTPVIITNEKMAKTNKPLVKKFMKGLSEGYSFAIKHPKEAAGILVKDVPELDRGLVLNSQQWLSKQYQADSSRWGVQKQEVWSRYADWMYKNKLLSKKIDTRKAFTNEFLPK
ncbi:ABC transporter substrate-binding protein [Fictibacillus gelatini]|uniref:ABC transporter substrate-binding protein n=1 Tax=Fictibacillus gelatini TaxID=225985 RepID=UPI0004012F0F|nr:ABC transporter substrate-binding protein [Fictibacillus gelatini]